MQTPDYIVHLFRVNEEQSRAQPIIVYQSHQLKSMCTTQESKCYIARNSHIILQITQWLLRVDFDANEKSRLSLK